MLRPYLVFLAAFPLLRWALPRAPKLTLAISLAMWVAAHGAHGLHFYDPIEHAPWTFNPFAWQLVFVLGAALRMVLAERENLPRTKWAEALAFVIIACGLVYRLGHLSLPVPLFKENVSPVRLVNALALVYLGLSRAWRPVGALAACGRHSLPVFSAGIMLSLVVDLVFLSLGHGIVVQIVATTAGVLLLVALARGLDAQDSRRF